MVFFCWAPYQASGVWASAKMLVYAISGEKGSGKSTLARKLVHPNSVRSIGYDLKGEHRSDFFRSLIKNLKTNHIIGFDRVAIDDVCGLGEISLLRNAFDTVVHFHISSSATQYDNMNDAQLALALKSDYAIVWDRT